MAETVFVRMIAGCYHSSFNEISFIYMIVCIWCCRNIRIFLLSYYSHQIKFPYSFFPTIKWNLLCLMKFSSFIFLLFLWKCECMHRRKWEKIEWKCCNWNKIKISILLVSHSIRWYSKYMAFEFESIPNLLIVNTSCSNQFYQVRFDYIFMNCFDIECVLGVHTYK